LKGRCLARLVPSLRSLECIRVGALNARLANAFQAVGTPRVSRGSPKAQIGHFGVYTGSNVTDFDLLHFYKWSNYQ